MTWSEMPAEDRSLHVNRLLLLLDKKLRLPEPERTVGILVPEGSREEVSSLWYAVVRASVHDPALHDPAHPQHSLYYPPVVESPKATSPALYTDRDEEYSRLLLWFKDRSVEAGLALDSLAPTALTLDALRGAYLAFALLAPRA